MHEEEPRLPDEQTTQVLTSWRYAVAFSLFVTTTLCILAFLWIWFRDGSPHDTGFLALAWLVMTIALTLGVKRDNRLR